MTIDKSKLQLTVSWFDYNKQIIQSTIKNHLKNDSIEHYLEIGSFEGYSTVSIIDFLLEQKQDVKSLACVDSFTGGEEHLEQGLDMDAVEKRFDNNMSVMFKELNFDKTKFSKIKGDSTLGLTKLIISYYNENAKSSEQFDLIYVDASHTAYDSLVDLVLAWKLLKKGGLLIFDDYLWGNYLSDEQHTPKLGFDSFAKCFKGQFELAFAKQNQRQYQMHIRKF